MLDRRVLRPRPRPRTPRRARREALARPGPVATAAGEHGDADYEHAVARATSRPRQDRGCEPQSQQRRMRESGRALPHPRAARRSRRPSRAARRPSGSGPEAVASGRSSSALAATTARREHGEHGLEARRTIPRAGCTTSGTSASRPRGASSGPAANTSAKRGSRQPSASTAERDRAVQHRGALGEVAEREDRRGQRDREPEHGDRASAASPAPRTIAATSSAGPEREEASRRARR